MQVVPAISLNSLYYLSICNNQVLSHHAVQGATVKRQRVDENSRTNTETFCRILAASRTCSYSIKSASCVNWMMREFQSLTEGAQTHSSIQYPRLFSSGRLDNDFEVGTIYRSALNHRGFS